jgi:hypothetical protein
MKPMPITYVWRQVWNVPDEFSSSCMAMVPLPRYARYAASQFGEPGGEHTLEPTSVRNMAFHNKYYAELTEAYHNLPEREAKKYPSLEHFRKRLLIMAGYGYDRHRAFATHAQAQRASDVLGDMIDEFSVVHVEDNVVVVRRAMSQDLSHMKKEEFEASAKAVLDLAAKIVGITPGQLKQNAGRSA